jgi:hypothetical protein
MNPVTVNGLMKESFTSALRPSTALDFLFSRAPPELSSPHVIQRCSERILVEELLALYFNDANAQEGEPSGSDTRVDAELAHWQVIQVGTVGRCSVKWILRGSSGGPVAIISVRLIATSSIGAQSLHHRGHRRGRKTFSARGCHARVALEPSV